MLFINTILCVQTWLTALPAAQTFLASSLLKQHTLTNAAQVTQINVACVHQISGKELGIIVVGLPTSKQVIYDMVLTMLTNLVAKDPDHPCDVLLRDQFSARIGHNGVHLDDLDDAQLVDRLRARPLLVLGPYQLPDKLAQQDFTNLSLDDRIAVLEQLGTRASCQAYIDVLGRMDMLRGNSESTWGCFAETASRLGIQLRDITESTFVCFGKLVSRLVGLCTTRWIPTTGQPSQPSPAVVLLDHLCTMFLIARQCTQFDVRAFAVPTQTIGQMLKIGSAQDRDCVISHATPCWPFTTTPLLFKQTAAQC